MASLRDSAARIFESRATSTALSVLEKADRGRSDRVMVLTYHRIDHPAARPHLAPSLLSTTPTAFDAQVSFLARKMHPLSLEELLDALRTGQAPRRAVHVTIDDAYRDVIEYAWPILTRHGVPATLFVPTEMPGRPTGYWWDRLHHALTRTHRNRLQWRGQDLDLTTPAARAKAYRQAHDEIRDLNHDEAMACVDELVAACDVPAAPAEILDWDELRTLARAGLRLAPHTHSHPRLDRIDLDRAVAEIGASVDELSVRLGAPVQRILAYPYGDHGRHAAEAARLAGVEAAFTTTRGAIELPAHDRMRLRRINVGRRSSVNALRFQAGSWMRVGGR